EICRFIWDAISIQNHCVGLPLVGLPLCAIASWRVFQCMCVGSAVCVCVCVCVCLSVHAEMQNICHILFLQSNLRYHYSDGEWSSQWLFRRDIGRGSRLCAAAVGHNTQESWCLMCGINAFSQRGRCLKASPKQQPE